MGAEKSFTLRIVTPERVFYEGNVDMVEMNTTEGQIGVLPGHIPLTVVIAPGVLTIYEASAEKKAALHAGFCVIEPDKVAILAEVIEWPQEIDEERAKEAMERAEERLHSRTPQTDIARAETALQRAIARISVLH